MKYFKPKKCKDFQNFISKADLFNKGWIFRGQKIVTWRIDHRFERACKRFNVIKNNRIRVENNMIREFKRRFHQYSGNVPEESSNDEWLALMQHYGAPTRLLDFTYSPYVAAYFAFEFAEHDSCVAIWAVNNGWFTKQFKNISEQLYQKYREYVNHREKFGIYFNDIFMPEQPLNFLLTVNPFRLNERLAYQRGVFLCPGNVSVSLIENLSNYKSEDLRENIIKYIISTGIKNKNTIEALEILDLMNISRTTLFPGLDGFAQSFEPRTKSLFERQYGH